MNDPKYQSYQGRIAMPADIWAQIEATAEDCRKAWGMGFPVISIYLLKQILKRQAPGKPGHSIDYEQV